MSDRHETIERLRGRITLLEGKVGARLVLEGEYFEAKVRIEEHDRLWLVEVSLAGSTAGGFVASNTSVAQMAGIIRSRYRALGGK